MQPQKVNPIIWQEQQLQLLDQRILPQQISYISYSDATSVADAITAMVVRGAPAIGISAAYGVVLSAIQHQRDSSWRDRITTNMNYLAKARPTAVNLHWALQKMRPILESATQEDVVALLQQQAIAIHEADISDNHTMGKLGASLLQSNDNAVLTHCNAGALATGGYGTALGVIRAGFANGTITQVYADETRPWMQGARLTAWEMVQEQIPVTLLVEGAAASLMRQGKISWLIVGSDRIAANGDVANKIGTYSAAVAAKYHGVKVMVVAPTSTVDMELSSGEDIPIEQRDGAEILQGMTGVVAAQGASAWNPVFDVTPAELVDVIVTEKGIVHNPTTEKIAEMMRR